MQAKLLRVLPPPSGEKLTYREYYPVGSRTQEHSDVRIIAARNRDLQAMAKAKTGEQGSFRSDLLFRLSAIVINLPPLRERPNDILPIADALLNRTNTLFAGSPRYSAKKLSPKTRIIIQKYKWPRNVRDLSNTILRGATMAEGEFILPEDLGISQSELPSILSHQACLENESIFSSDFSINEHLEKELKKWGDTALERANTKTEAAKWLVLVSPQALDAKLKNLA